MLQPAAAGLIPFWTVLLSQYLKTGRSFLCMHATVLVYQSCVWEAAHVIESIKKSLVSFAI